jgi:hypothetical protein
MNVQHAEHENSFQPAPSIGVVTKCHWRENANELFYQASAPVTAPESSVIEIGPYLFFTPEAYFLEASISLQVPPLLFSLSLQSSLPTRSAGRSSNPSFQPVCPRLH